jgi:hypothetical protein
MAHCHVQAVLIVLTEAIAYFHHLRLLAAGALATPIIQQVTDKLVALVAAQNETIGQVVREHLVKVITVQVLAKQIVVAVAVERVQQVVRLHRP